MKALIALSASFAAIGCATGGLVGTGDQRAISPQVAQQAAQQHPQIVQEFGGELGGQRGAYVQEVGRRIGAQSGIQGAGTGGYNFTALNSPVMNAFAVPGGYIYITRQLMALMNDEAELASVLGHEVGHVAADHARGRQQRGILTQLGALAVGVLTGSGQLAQIAGTVGQGVLNTYSQAQEFESDALGIRYMTAAGYDPMASPSMLASLGAHSALEARFTGRQDDQRATPSWARTHPLSADRVARATQQAQATGRAGQGERNRDRHLQMISGMIFDDDPAQGVIEGRDFLHPDLRLAFTVPQGFGMQNGTRAVAVIGQSGQAQFSTGPFQGNLGTYIGQVFQGLTGGQGQAQVPQVQSTTVNGIPAAFATTRAQTQQGQVDVTVFAYQFENNRAYHFVTLTQAGTGLGPFSSMVQSVRRLTAQQAAAIRPRVVQIVTVGANDTVQSLANRMAYTEHQVDRFRVLNALGPNDGVRAGQRVKLVVYGNR
ncbi:MAG: M48 family metalloprotease [Allosphingosinicella sp.]|uniref:M48 family metalloprotease n=1 Tax=Allosphingosinicella sp. TaxID=2823234 RepID=UPI00395D4CA7